MTTNRESFGTWLAQACAEWLKQKRHSERYGQFLWNRMPDRFLNRVPRGIDPFYDDSNIENFLTWLERNW